MIEIRITVDSYKEGADIFAKLSGEEAPAPAQAAPTRAPAQAAPTRAPAQAAPTRAPAQAAPTRAPAQAAPTRAPAQAAPTRAPAQPTPTRKKRTLDEIADAILGYLDEHREPVSASRIASGVATGPQTAVAAIDILVREGSIVDVGNGNYQLAQLAEGETDGEASPDYPPGDDD